MKFLKIFTLDKILFLSILIGSIWGYWYFEESIILRILTIFIALFGLGLGYLRKNNNYSSSKLELAALLTLYLGSFTLYNLLYNINLPLYLIMLLILILVSALFYCLINIDKLNQELEKDIFWLFIILLALTALEIFLSLYFWPIGPEIKSLVIVVVFYLIINLIYLYIHNMLRLKRIIGFVLVSLLILGIVLLTTWLRMPR